MAAHNADIYMLNLVPLPQGFSLKKWEGREKALASAGHVYGLSLFLPHPFFEGKALGTRLIHACRIQRKSFEGIFVRINKLKRITELRCLTK